MAGGIDGIDSIIGSAQSCSPVIMTGCQRSGTTYLARLLQEGAGGAFGVEDCVIRTAILWFDWALRNRDMLPYARFNEFAQIFSTRGNGAAAVARLSDILIAFQNSPAMAEILEGGRTEEFIRALCHAYHAWNREGTVHYWGDKYPEYLFQLRQIEAVFPAARYVFVTRNPQSTVEALLRKLPQRDGQVAGKHVFSVEACAHQWAVWNRQWLDFEATIPADRKLVVCYEAFVTDPVAGVRALETFVGAPLSTNERIAAHLRRLDAGRLERVRSSPHYDHIVEACAAPEVRRVAGLLGY